MVRERGLIPLQSPTSCGEHLLLDLHGSLLVMAISNPFSLLLLALGVYRESGRTREREGVWE
jgi:hypothetical protein